MKMQVNRHGYLKVEVKSSPDVPENLWGALGFIQKNPDENGNCIFIHDYSDKIVIHKDNLEPIHWTSDFVADKMFEWFDQFVPPQGKAETWEGEIIRAYNRLVYRYYNDGDYFNEGYGVETCGHCYLFLLDLPVRYDGFRDNLIHMGGEDYVSYELILEQLGRDIIKVLTPIIEAGETTKAHRHMDDYKEEALNRWGEDENEEDDW